MDSFSLVRQTAKGEPYVYVVSPEELIKQILEYARRYRAGTHDAVAVDCETNGDDPYTTTIFTLQLAVNSEVGLSALVIDMRTALSKEALLVLNGYLTQPGLTKIFQGGKFELKMLSQKGVILSAPHFDTMLVSQILMSGQQEGSKLGDLSQRYLGVALDKLLQTSFLNLPPDAVLSDEQIEYAVEDVLILVKLKPVIEEALKQYRSAEKTWKREQSLLPLVAALEVGGIQFCEQGLAKLHDHLQRQVGTHKVYAEGYLLGTPTVWGGYEPVDLDKAESVKDALIAQGIAYSSDKDSDLLHQADEPAVMSLLQYRHSRRQFEIVQRWQSLGLRRCGKRQVNLFPKYSQVEYMSGRLSHSHTGIEQILPVNEEQQVRRLAGLLASRQAGMSLIDVALSEAPMRVLAQVSQNSALLNLYRAGHSAVDRLGESLEIDNQVAWALWIGAGVYGNRSAKKWQQFVYQETGTVLAPDQAKQILSKFWELMEPLKRWHQIKPVPKEWSFTSCGRYRYGHRSSHADVMAHRVMGTLSDLVKEAAIEIHQALTPLGGKPYLILGSRLIWEVPTSRQHETADLAAQMLMERCRRVLPDVVKEYEAEVLAAVPVRNVLL